MLSGRQAFEARDSVSDAVAAILTREPDWTALPDGIPSPVLTLLRRCLQKDPGRRLHHIADARLELEDAISRSPELAAANAERAGLSPLWRRALPWVVMTLAMGVAGWTLWVRTGLRDAGTSPLGRLELNLPAGVELLIAANRSVALSADGASVAFVGVLWVVDSSICAGSTGSKRCRCATPMAPRRVFSHRKEDRSVSLQPPACCVQCH